MSGPQPANAKLQTIELFIGNLLRYGVLLCTAVTAIGIAMSLAGFEGGGSSLTTFLHDVMQGRLLPSGDPLPCFAEHSVFFCLQQAQPVVALGLVLLIALPVLRVGMTVVVFAVQRDWIYTLISGIVLAVLLTGLILGKEL